MKPERWTVRIFKMKEGKASKMEVRYKENSNNTCGKETKKERMNENNKTDKGSS